MTADTTRRLLSIDLLDEAEHARLDEIGNRAVLTQPAPAPVSIPELLAAQVAHTPEAAGPARRCPVTAVMGWSCALTRRPGRGQALVAGVGGEMPT